MDPGQRGQDGQGARVIGAPFMSNFTEVWSVSGVAPLSRVRYARRENHEWLVPDTPEDADITESLLAGLINTEQNPEQAAFYALNILCVAYPELGPLLSPAFEEMGTNLCQVKIPSQAAANFLQIPTLVYRPLHLSVIHATIFILMFKNVTSVNYDNFINRRITALRAIVGLPEVDEYDLKIMTLEKAISFKARIGNNLRIKRDILVKVLPYTNLSSDTDASALLYAARISAWTDMTVITYIVDGLLRTKSPALRHPGVAGEISNLKQAMVAILNCQYPQFFRVIAGPHQRELVERNRFPVLASLAWEIRKMQYPTLNQFVGATAASGGTLVAQLIAIHRSYFSEHVLVSRVRAVDLLTNFEDEEDTRTMTTEAEA